jgi:predicted alpha/beta-hydrolase family hydrolase
VREITVTVDGALQVSASLHGEGATAVVLGHGAGGNRLTPLLLSVAEGLAGSGRQGILYNFPYTEQRRRAPDPPARLEATIEAVAREARALGASRVVLGGKSMGGRIASQAVAKGTPADGLVFLGYPLHPPGRTEQLRDKHLPAIRTPMLFLQGTRDDFARFDLIEAVVARLQPLATLVAFEAADHSYRVPKKSGLLAADIEKRLIDAILGWLDERGL